MNTKQCESVTISKEALQYDNLFCQILCFKNNMKWMDIKNKEKTEICYKLL